MLCNKKTKFFQIIDKNCQLFVEFAILEFKSASFVTMT